MKIVDLMSIVNVFLLTELTQISPFSTGWAAG